MCGLPEAHADYAQELFPAAADLLRALCGYLVKLSSDRAKRKVEQQPRACAACGKKFKPRRKDAVYCSLRCRVAMHRRKI